MDQTLILMGTAVAVGVGHTAIGVDHTLPFVAIGRAQRWSLARTLWITTLCGAGHVLSSLVLGAVGAALGVAAHQLNLIDGVRAELASWSLVALGLGYALYSFGRTRSGRASHRHLRFDEADAGDLSVTARFGRTGWVLLALFILGPCEVLFPLLIPPASEANFAATFAVLGAFGGATLLTMNALVAAGYFGLKRVRWAALEQHWGTIAGLAVALSGLCIIVLGV